MSPLPAPFVAPPRLVGEEEKKQQQRTAPADDDDVVEAGLKEAVLQQPAQQWTGILNAQERHDL